jgi:hypothetical protein
MLWLFNIAKKITVLRFLSCLLLLLLSLQGWASARLDGFTAQFAVNIGQAERTNEGLLLTPEPDSGKIYLTYATGDIALEQFTRVAIELAGDAPLQGFLLWQTKTYGEQVFQFRIDDLAGGQSVLVDMTDRQAWEGVATMIGLGLYVPSKEALVLRDFSVDQPALADRLGELVDAWTSFTPWRAFDINLYTGVRQFGQGPHPVPIAAGVLASILLLYFVFAFRGERRGVNWHTVGGVVLACWIALDLLWQSKLTRQVQQTYALFAGLSSQEQLLASEDAPVVRFASEAKSHISAGDARVFVASQSDWLGMLAAYYLSPLNVYWHRKGPELPSPELLVSGDYVFLVRPSALEYDPARSMISIPGGGHKAAVSLYSSPMGELFQVM